MVSLCGTPEQLPETLAGGGAPESTGSFQGAVGFEIKGGSERMEQLSAWLEQQYTSIFACMRAIMRAPRATSMHAKKYVYCYHHRPFLLYLLCSEGGVQKGFVKNHKYVPINN